MWVKYPGNKDAGEVINHVVGHGDLIATIDAELSEYDLSPPDHTAPLQQDAGRHVVSVSNTAKRLTEEDGKFVIRRNGSSDKVGDISDEGREFVESLPYPECRNSRGEALGVEEAERRQRLANLGYQ